MSRFWRIWKYALGSFSDEKTKRYDNLIVLVRSFIFLTYLITNSFIVAGVIRHWGDGQETGTPPKVIFLGSAMMDTSEENNDS